jgi:hypothetical protein
MTVIYNLSFAFIFSSIELSIINFLYTDCRKVLIVKFYMLYLSLIIREVLMKWPEHFPNACPPSDSSDCRGRIFRIVKNGGPEESDFLSYWVLKPERQPGWLKTGRACNACGLSVLISMEDALEVLEIVQGIGDKIAVAEFEAGTGKIKHTPSGRHENHHTWWVPVHVEKPWTLFKIVA